MLPIRRFLASHYGKPSIPKVQPIKDCSTAVASYGPVTPLTKSSAA